jgi:cell filamentation protein
MPDKYTYPDTEVLKNKFGVQDTMLLHAYERKYVTPRLVELKQNPIEGNFDLDHLKKIHEHLFQDIYTWAGNIRDIDIGRVDEVTGNTTEFCETHLIDGFSEDIFRKLKKDNYLCGIDQDSFSSKAAELIGELNALHPFREGNGRTQREFMRELAQNAGWELNFDNITRERMVEASIAAFEMDYSQMEDIIKESLRPLEITKSTEWEVRIKEIEEALPVSELRKDEHSKKLYNSYAKEELLANKNDWTGLDKKVAIRLMKDGFSDSKIDATLKYSPSMLGKKLIEQSIAVRTIIREVKQENPELKKSHAYSLKGM